MKSCINGGTPEVEMLFCFKEKENGGECLEIAVEPETTAGCWMDHSATTLPLHGIVPL